MSEYGEIANLPAGAAENGITGVSGFVLDAADQPFKTALVSYLVFDDPSAAAAYLEKLGRNFTQSLSEPVTFELSNGDEAPIEVRCVFVPDTNNGVNCHHLAHGGRIVAATLLADGPLLRLDGGEPAIFRIFDDTPSRTRLMAAVSESASYLLDAVARR